MDKEEFEMLLEKRKEVLKKFENEMAEAEGIEEVAYAFARKAGALSALIDAYEIDVRYHLKGSE